MKKFLGLSLAFLMVLTSVLTGCNNSGGNASNTATNTTANTATNTATNQATQGDNLSGTVVHYTINEDDKMYVTELSKRFMVLHPNVKIEIMTAPYNEFDSKLQTLVSSGSAPDVTSHYAFTGFAEMYSLGLLQDITPYLKQLGTDPVSIGIPQKLVDIYSIGGEVYGIPVSAYVSLMAYNKDLFDAAGVSYPTVDWEDTSWTYDKMVEMAKKLTVHSNDPNTMQFGLDFSWAERDMRPIYFGAKVYSDDGWTNGGRPSKCYFDSPEVIAASNQWNTLINDLNVMPTADQSRGITGVGAYEGDSFATGKVAMSVSGSWILAGMNDFDFKVGIAAIPVGGDPNVRSPLFVDPLVLLKGSKNPVAATAWMMFVASEDSQRYMLESPYNNPPANSRVMDDYYKSLSGVDPADVKTVYDGAVKYGIESYNHVLDKYTEINDIVTNEWAQFENGPGADVPAVMKTIQDKVQAILDSNK
ncbi:MAG: sugar ABC transporter substrate-binding protein [Oscillospiraceae bacterium]|nr:sugar ABC transporter substrate-binding protein [Oscillospiraceae bacterium]